MNKITISNYYFLISLEDIPNISDLKEDDLRDVFTQISETHRKLSKTEPNYPSFGQIIHDNTDDSYCVDLNNKKNEKQFEYFKSSIFKFSKEFPNYSFLIYHIFFDDYFSIYRLQNDSLIQIHHEETKHNKLINSKLGFIHLYNFGSLIIDNDITSLYNPIYNYEYENEILLGNYQIYIRKNKIKINYISPK